MKVRTETELGWRHLVDAYGNRSRIDLFHAMKNKELNIPSPLDDPAQMKALLIMDFCKLMMVQEKPSIDLVFQKNCLIQSYWWQAEQVGNMMKKACKSSREYQEMVHEFVSLIESKGNHRNLLLNKVPIILLKYLPIHILRARQFHHN